MPFGIKNILIKFLQSVNQTSTATAASYQAIIIRMRRICSAAFSR